jgi:hypothetical protein
MLADENSSKPLNPEERKIIQEGVIGNKERTQTNLLCRLKVY